MRVLVALSLLSLSLAGCASAPELEGEELYEAQVDLGVASDVPVWAVGMYWEYETTGGVQTLVVTNDGGTSYTVDTNDKGAAYFDAMFDITFVGEVSKSSLAGSQNGQRVEMFDWPLAPGKEWKTTWDGDELNMIANEMGNPGEFHVMGHRVSDGAMTVEYHYSPIKSWFEYIIWYDPETGDEQYKMSLKSNGDDYTGPVYRYTVEDVLVFEAKPQGLEQFNFNGGDAAEFGLRLVADCGTSPAGQILVAFTKAEGDQQAPPLPIFNEPPFGTAMDCSPGVEEDRQAVYFIPEEERGSTYNVDMALFTVDGSATMFVEPRMVEIITL